MGQEFSVIEEIPVAIYKDDVQRDKRSQRWSDASELDTWPLKGEINDGSPFANVAQHVDKRRPARKDIDRVLYAPAWRRLAGVTQIFTPPEGQPRFHSRLTHSQKVSQVSRGIAEQLIIEALDEKEKGDVAKFDRIRDLGGLDVEVAEAAGLLHDIGHPPFGHIGEGVLAGMANKWKLADGFEGNAQTIRIVCQGFELSPNHEGLRLTRATIAALAKYPWIRERLSKQLRVGGDRVETFHSRKFSFYDSEADLLDWCREFAADEIRGTGRKTLEAAIMDIADDITYAVHDLEDLYFGGVLRVDGVLSALKSFLAGGRETLSKNRCKIGKNIFSMTAKQLSNERKSRFSSELFRSACVYVCETLELLRSSQPFDTTMIDVRLVSSQHRLFTYLIEKYIGEVQFTCDPDSDAEFVELTPGSWHEIEVWKAVTKGYIQNDADLAIYQLGQKRVLTDLCEQFAEWCPDTVSSEELVKLRLPTALLYELRVYAQQNETNKMQSRRSNLSAPRGGNARRAILDYLCTLNDAQCIELHQNLFGGRIHDPGFGFTY